MHIWRRSVLLSWIDHVNRRLNPVFVKQYRAEKSKGWLETKCIRGKEVRTKQVNGVWQTRKYPYDVQYTWSPTGLERYKAWHAARRRQPSVKKSFAPARDCIIRGVESSWWEWGQGSSLFFWRWPPSHRVWAMEGQPHFVTGDLPSFKKPQKPAKLPEHMVKMKEKVMKVRRRLYIETGEVLSLTHMFCVPKGLLDIRMVYNGTSCGLN
ncbi:hypothetical protein ACHAXR_000940, partial [Thalassiosira sp. AJA248-18]